MKIFNKINGDFIKRGIILLGVIIGINVVYIGGNIYKNDGGDVKENKYYKITDIVFDEKFDEIYGELNEGKE